MYLSRVVLNPRHRAVRHDLADCYALHRTVLSAFPAGDGNGGRAGLGVLYRLESHPRTGEPTLLVQSRVRPDWSGLRRTGYLRPLDPEEEPDTKPVDPLYAALRAGMRLRFRLRANPTRRLSTPPGPDGARPRGKRVDLRDEAAQLAWLERKGADHGFALVRGRARPDVANVRTQPEGQQTGYRSLAEPDGGERRAQRLTFGAVLFEGELAITDADALRRALAEGIGSAKAYGFGLLSIAPIREE